MKNRILSGFFNIIIGVLISFGPSTIFKVCEKSEKIMKCYWSSRAEIGVGILFIATGLLYLGFKHWETSFALNIVSFVISIIAILIPAVLIGGCGNVMMVCRSLSFPVIYVLSVLSGVYAIGNSIYLIKKAKQNV
jgi:hypothetical protein